MSRIKTLLTNHKIHAKKRLGQNFLDSESALESIADCAGLSKEDPVIEIGAGIGNLSEIIAARSKEFYAIEKDRRVENILKKTLKPYPDAQVIIGDVLKFDLNNIFKGKRFIVIGNLPYYITTPILNQLIENRQYIKTIVITVQKEVAERMVSKPGTKDYGRLSCLVQFYTKAEIVEIFPKKLFFPVPEVDSALVKLEILDTPSIEVKSEKVFFSTVRAIFGQRRKTLLNELSNTGWPLKKDEIAEILAELDIDPQLRGEKLSLRQIGMLADKIDSKLPK